MFDELNTTQNPQPVNRNAVFATRNPQPATLIRQPAARFFQSKIQNLKSKIEKPATRIPRRVTRNPLFSIQNPKSKIQNRETRNLQRATSIQYPASSIQYPVSNIQHPVSSIQYPASGFTLMEILLAFLILSIVITTILGSFNAVFSTTDTLENSGAYYNMAKSCLNRMKTDLEALYVAQPPFYKKPEFDDPPDTYRFVGSVEDAGGISFAKLRFTSHAHIPFDSVDRDGIAEIIYYVQAKNDGQMVLKRSDHLYPYPEFEEKGGDPVLCRYVKSLAFKYFDADGEESETWNSDEDDFDHATPTAVSIMLEIGNESETVAFETTVKLPLHRKKLE